MKLTMELGVNSYDIHVEHGILSRAGEIFNLNRRVLVLSEPGVPQMYAQTVLAQCKEGALCLFDGGEEGKTMQGIERALEKMTECSFTRGDCVVAVGGGVVGDMGGFAASLYMRGIDFYNIPTTLLSQIDSSIGGKTGINFAGVKNLVGAFHQPRGVLIDPDLLETLPPRQIAAGMAEAIKMAMTFDVDLIEEMERGDLTALRERIIIRSLEMKKAVVEEDEKEQGLRRVLNFGHTVGHGIEALGTGLYHGECVALGMLTMCEGTVRDRLRALLEKANLPIFLPQVDQNAILDLVMHDKKRTQDGVMAVLVPQIGAFDMKKLTRAEIGARMKEAFGA